MRIKEKPQIHWAITGKHGLYVGTWYRRIEAIIYHTEAKGQEWRKCRKDGDRAIKVYVIPLDSVIW